MLLVGGVAHWPGQLQSQGRGKLPCFPHDLDRPSCRFPAVGQRFSNLNVQGLNTQIAGLPQFQSHWVCGGRGRRVSNSSQATLILLAGGPHLENHCRRGRAVLKNLNLDYNSV